MDHPDSGCGIHIEGSAASKSSASPQLRTSGGAEGAAASRSLNCACCWSMKKLCAARSCTVGSIPYPNREQTLVKWDSRNGEEASRGPGSVPCASPQSKTHQEQCILKSSLTSGPNLSVVFEWPDARDFFVTG